jgi:hypothetical protein
MEFARGSRSPTTARKETDMKIRSLIAAALAAIGLSACGSIPQGPALTYEQLLPNTHENPVWAKQVQQPAPQAPTQ